MYANKIKTIAASELFLPAAFGQLCVTEWWCKRRQYSECNSRRLHKYKNYRFVQRGYDKEQIGQLMAEIVVNANMKIFEASTRDPELAGMGTTCEFVFVKDTTVHIVHVGDSRTYAIRGGKIKQLTEDHSVFRKWFAEANLPMNRLKTTQTKLYHTCFGNKAFCKT